MTDSTNECSHQDEKCGTDRSRRGSLPHKACFMASCETPLADRRDRYCPAHARAAKAWMRDQRRLDFEEYDREPRTATSWDWADWDWDGTATKDLHGAELKRFLRRNDRSSSDDRTS